MITFFYKNDIKWNWKKITWTMFNVCER